ncbi:hypothetical protein PY365_03225 [Roseiarcaceae bacterium H3SJ34-1]|uniref:hypothetical protein n=1 Tax=Terripilifer ovatus TaxID=3032367 RepID=UPI003AB92EF9|nr:hypothetical protein [Roseiarcaceae bacterium H3SJ34-1]
MRRAFAFRLTSLRLGLAILAIHAMLAMGFVDAVTRSAAASSLPAGVGVICLSDWSGSPDQPPPYHSGHDGTTQCPAACMHPVAFGAAALSFDAPERVITFAEPPDSDRSGIQPSVTGREGAPVRGPPAMDRLFS